MKKLISLMLVVLMVFLLISCKEKDVNNYSSDISDFKEETVISTPSETDEEDATENEDPEKENEVLSSSEEVSSEDEESVQVSKPTEPTKPVSPTHEHEYVGKVMKDATCTEQGLKKFTCACGSCYTQTTFTLQHKWGEWKTVKEPTASAEGNSQRKCNACGNTENKSIPKLSNPTTSTPSPYYVGYEIVSRNTPNTCYVDGVNLLDIVYGKDNAYQTGDQITYKINMSDGGSKGFEVITVGACTYTVNGNLVTIIITDGQFGATWAIKTTDKNGKELDVVKRYEYIIRYNGKLETAHAVMEGIFRDYARIRYGIAWNSQLHYKDGYTADRNNDPSITGNHGDGTLDDCIFKDQTSNWVKDALWLIDQYNKIGIKEWDCNVGVEYFGALGRK